MNPLVSVVIPVYNSAEYIVETIKSALAQHYKPFEVIVVDDGSTDNTKDLLEPYLHRISYLYKENGGPASARNTGVNNAKGEYIAFLDADDLWMPEKLARQMDVFNQDKSIGLVHTQYLNFENSFDRLLLKEMPANNGNASGYVFPRLFLGKFCC